AGLALLSAQNLASRRLISAVCTAPPLGAPTAGSSGLGSSFAFGASGFLGVSSDRPRAGEPRDRPAAQITATAQLRCHSLADTNCMGPISQRQEWGDGLWLVESDCGDLHLNAQAGAVKRFQVGNRSPD